MSESWLARHIHHDTEWNGLYISFLISLHKFSIWLLNLLWEDQNVG